MREKEVEEEDEEEGEVMVEEEKNETDMTHQRFRLSFWFRKE